MASNLFRRLLTRVGGEVEFFADRKKAEGRVRDGGVYYAYTVARVVGCVALWGLSIASLRIREGRDSERDDATEGGTEGKWDVWLHVSICVTFVRRTSVCFVSRVTKAPSLNLSRTQQA